MEERSSLKMDYDHYLQKIDNLKTKSNVDANYSIKVGSGGPSPSLEPNQVAGRPDQAPAVYRRVAGQVLRLRGSETHLPRLRVPDHPFRPEEVLHRPGSVNGWIQDHGALRAPSSQQYVLRCRLMVSHSPLQPRCPAPRRDGDGAPAELRSGPHRCPRGGGGSCSPVHGGQQQPLRQGHSC